MKNKFKFYYLLFMLLHPELSFAQVDTLGEMLERVSDQLGSTGGLFRISCYIAGLGFTMSGIMKIKEHASMGGKMSTKDVVSRLCAGAFFIYLPALINVIINSTVGQGGEMDLLVGGLD
ncbi:MAG: hypothetical protein N4A43_02175 [Alphaproteobacteria bacterium]|jgi:hypothetical protein|nr:hypothetical protein [Alphaproteobacteria bacterium]